MKKFNFLWITIFALLLTDASSYACSSFMLKSKNGQIYGHNLEIGGQMPGMIFINKSDTQKKGFTWKLLTSADKLPENNLTWVSKYGSVTFNAFGREFPDGGMNEKGLYIWEMTGKSSFDTVANRPRLFMSQWMQYQLDNYHSVNEVLQNLSAVGLDGWNWHFFVADKQGKAASIEFIDGMAYVNAENNLPIPLMGNGRYTDDLSFIKEFKGFGGQIELDLTDPNLPGFVKAAKLISDYNDNENIVDYGFGILGHLSSNPKWSVIFDVVNMKVYFKTAAHKNIKYFSLKSFDFTSATTVKTLDIQNADLDGDVTPHFSDFSQADNEALIRAVIQKVLSKDSDPDIDPEILISNLANAHMLKKDQAETPIKGIWTGYAEYPTTGEPAKVDWKIEIDETNGILSGSLSDNVGLFDGAKLLNLEYKNGIISFTTYTKGYIFKVYSQLSEQKIRGIFEISNEPRKGNFMLEQH